MGDAARQRRGCVPARLVRDAAQERLPLSAYRRPLLGTGLCGALTTFSAMRLELLQMIDAGRFGLALAYALVSVVAGFTAVAAATNVVRRARLRA